MHQGPIDTFQIWCILRGLNVHSVRTIGEILDRFPQSEVAKFEALAELTLEQATRLYEKCPRTTSLTLGIIQSCQSQG